MSKLWGGRYTGVTDELMWAFNASIGFDKRLAQVDIVESIAYAHALARAGVLAEDEAATLVGGLQQIAAEFERGSFAFAPLADKLQPTPIKARVETCLPDKSQSTPIKARIETCLPDKSQSTPIKARVETCLDEDIHTAVERRLGELLGPLAGKLHTGRSRNDQVATDIRLYLMGELAALGQALRRAQASIVLKAEEHLDVLMPGYTHLQPAQPVRFSHWLLSYFWMLERDHERLGDLLKRVAICPLGAGALAGNAYGIDREALARELGFCAVTENSMDAVSDRDMILETLSWAAILGLHLSRLAEDLILYSSAEFGFLRLDERYTTGSSIMPQKRNPDSMELVRGKTGRLVGNLVSLLVVVKGLPSTYDKDLQEDKEPLLDTLDTLGMILPIVAGVIETLEVNGERMRAALVEGLLATDLADYLVKRGVPFREAHGLVGRAVLLGEERGVPLSQLPLEDYQAISPAFGADLYAALDFEAAVEARSVTGGTALAAVLTQLERAKETLGDH